MRLYLGRANRGCKVWGHRGGLGCFRNSGYPCRVYYVVVMVRKESVIGRRPCDVCWVRRFVWYSICRHRC